jgi:hypothetical protein
MLAEREIQNQFGMPFDWHETVRIAKVRIIIS